MFNEFFVSANFSKNGSNIDPSATSTGPAWDNTAEYSSISAREITNDLTSAEEIIKTLEALSRKVSPFIPKADCSSLSKSDASEAVRLCQEINTLAEKAAILISNVSTFASCEQSVDGKNTAAKTLLAKTKQLFSKIVQVTKSVDLFLTRTTEEIKEEYLNHPERGTDRFQIEHERKHKDFLLPLEQEELIVGLSLNGPIAWSTLYDNIAGTLTCEIDLPEGKMSKGLAAANLLLESDKEDVRKTAFQAINKAWESQEEACSSILNSLAGWRLDVYQRRSQKKPYHFLDEPLHRGNISSQTLSAMMESVAEARDFARHTMKLCAKVLGKNVMSPWDRFTPAPVIHAEQNDKGAKIPFEKAISIIKDSFQEIDPAMADFVSMMTKNRWIEGTVGTNKRPGAYCTKFLKSRSPRVYMTYNGSLKNIVTLAHELGHAFHSWSMRDMPLSQLSYPMTLAETASIFAETLTHLMLEKLAENKQDLFKIAWSDAQEVESFLLNIPARFDFEKSLFETRAEKILAPQDLKTLMIKSWEKWYGNTLTEMDPMFWASKLHFHIASLSFYNFPYTFGYLFALGVLNQRKKFGKDFFKIYVNLLRDTGRMTAEDLAKKHLNVDLTDKMFWKQSIDLIKLKMKHFKEMV